MDSTTVIDDPVTTAEAQRTHNLSRLIVPCKHCDRTVTQVVDSWLNYNPGDSVITPHLHANIIYVCGACDGRFVVRVGVDMSELYYGDFHSDGKVCDESAETQRVKREAKAAMRTGEKVLSKRPGIEGPFE